MWFLRIKISKKVAWKWNVSVSSWNISLVAGQIKSYEHPLVRFCVVWPDWVKNALFRPQKEPKFLASLWAIFWNGPKCRFQFNRFCQQGKIKFSIFESSFRRTLSRRIFFSNKNWSLPKHLGNIWKHLHALEASVCCQKPKNELKTLLYSVAY